MQSPLLSISGNVPTFLPRDAMCKRGLCCRPVSVRLSVRHVGVLYPNGWRYRQTFSRPVSPMMIVFWSRAPIPNSQGQRSRSQGRGHIVAASRTACLIVHWSSTAVITKWRIMWKNDTELSAIFGHLNKMWRDKKHLKIQTKINLYETFVMSVFCMEQNARQSDNWDKWKS